MTDVAGSADLWLQLVSVSIKYASSAAAVIEG